MFNNQIVGHRLVITLDNDDTEVGIAKFDCACMNLG